MPILNLYKIFRNNRVSTEYQENIQIINQLLSYFANPIYGQ